MDNTNRRGTAGRGRGEVRIPATTVAHERRGRRQWGSDTHKDPMPAIPVPVTDRTIAIGRFAIVATVIAWATFVTVLFIEEFVQGRAFTRQFGVEAIVYVVLMTLLTASAVAYLTARLGFFYRARDHWRVPRADLERAFAEAAPSLTVLVPSYQEEGRVVRMTLLSAALQEYPGLRVVLLVDDAPDVRYTRPRALLAAARALPAEVSELLAGPATRYRQAQDRFRDVHAAGGAVRLKEMHALAGLYEDAVSWLGALAAAHPRVDHSDDFFRDHVIGRLAGDLSLTARALRSAAAEGATLAVARLEQLHARLVSIFTAELSSFERKRYVSLSHEANKAMNLNSYIGLMGRRFHDVPTPAGRALVPAEDGATAFPDSDYILTLDADSVLLPEYCIRLVHLLEQSEHRRIAVAQTPYSSYPGSATRLERIAGATTDLQHIVHQGMTYYDATFWVGANAVLRKRALEEIVDVRHQGGWEIRRYVQDRTVIEDTDSSIDLRIHGWQLLNYPERLSYSSTPPDFGALCIQRRRWANGGLLILPKLRRQARAQSRRGEEKRFGEYFLRVNYMASIAWSTLALLVLLVYPFNDQILNPVLVFVALPYFLMVAADLRYCGYRRLDVLRVYAFNLLLVPVNLAGAGNSAVQWLTGGKVAFRRTPKVSDRTTTPLLFSLAPYALLGLSVYTIVNDVLGQRWVNLAYASLNAVLCTYAIVAFVGVRNSIVDIWVNLVSLLRQPEKSRRPGRAAPVRVTGTQSVADWAAVLHHGAEDHVPMVPGALAPEAGRAPSMGIPHESLRRTG
jgi:cellulose synthase/poly-beta-1,6-N-acetylglucosamine synthase-like glycosyltransferase